MQNFVTLLLFISLCSCRQYLNHIDFFAEASETEFDLTNRTNNWLFDNNITAVTIETFSRPRVDLNTTVPQIWSELTSYSSGNSISRVYSYYAEVRRIWFYSDYISVVPESTTASDASNSSEKQLLNMYLIGFSLLATFVYYF